jgi:hypothetical protein
LIDQGIEILEATLLFSLNPVTWAIVILVSIWAKRYWMPAFSGILAQIASLVPLVLYVDTTSAASSVYGYGLLDGEGVEGHVLIVSATVLSGIVISIIVMLFVGQRRKQLSEDVANKYQRNTV